MPRPPVENPPVALPAPLAPPMELAPAVEPPVALPAPLAPPMELAPAVEPPIALAPAIGPLPERAPLPAAPSPGSSSLTVHAAAIALALKVSTIARLCDGERRALGRFMKVSSGNVPPRGRLQANTTKA
jgi:hypothetical protein